MRVSARADYAIRALLELTAAGSGEPVRGDAMARAQGIPAKYLENLLADLRRARLVASQRGVNGGYRLARPASAITLADVIRAIDGPLAGVRDSAPEDVSYEGAAASLRDVWVALRASMRTVLEATTLADVATGKLPAGVASCCASRTHGPADDRTGPSPSRRRSPPAAARRPRHAGARHRPRRRRAQRGPAGHEMAERGIALRPHAKTHKSIELGRIQLAHGAAGLTVGNLGEAEVFAAAGFTDLFIAYPIWAVGEKASRLRALLADERLGLSVGFDSVEGAERLAAAVAGTAASAAGAPGARPGQPPHRRADPRTPGRSPPRPSAAGLEVRGLFTHGGHGYRVRATADRRRGRGPGADDRRDALRAVGIEPTVISAGSTPTQHSAAQSPVTEMRPGTYLLGDRQQWALGAQPSDGLAAVIAATVVSVAVDGQVVVDAGAKALTKDVAPYLAGHGAIPAYPDAVIERVSDYHGVVRFPGGTPAPRIGEVIAIVPNHICPVVDLRDNFVATRGRSIVGTWPVDARGRSG